MRKKLAIFSFLSVLLLAGAGCSSTATEETNGENASTTSTPEPTTSVTESEQKTYTFPGVLPDEQIQNKQIRIKTAKGDIVFELFADTAPNTVSNFVYLTSEGYYNGVIFHRRVEEFVIQGGDPLGTGRGGPGYTIAEETSDEYAYDRGIVAMAKTMQPHSTGSQFFIMLADTPLPKEYSIFGRVTERREIGDQIESGDEMISVTVGDKAT